MKCNCCCIAYALCSLLPFFLFIIEHPAVFVDQDNRRWTLKYRQSLQDIQQTITFSNDTDKQQELSLTYMDDNVGNEDPEILKLNLSVIHKSDKDKVIFKMIKSEITVLDNDGKICLHNYVCVSLLSKKLHCFN